MTGESSNEGCPKSGVTGIRRVYPLVGLRPRRSGGPADAPARSFCAGPFGSVGRSRSGSTRVGGARRDGRLGSGTGRVYEFVGGNGGECAHRDRGPWSLRRELAGVGRPTN